MKTITLTCDVCGTQKQKSNHWFLVSSSSSAIEVRVWDEEILERSYYQHICGQECAQKFLEQWMSK